MKGKSKSKANKGKPSDNGSIADSILATMMAVQLKRNSSSLSFVSLMKARKMNDRNTGWRNKWRKLIQEGYIQPAKSNPSSESSKASGNGIFTSDHELTEKGEEKVGSPEQKEIKRLMETTVNTTAQEHERIRKLCMNNRTVQIFDLLLKHGSLTRKELAATIGISDRGGPFSYGLRQLKCLGYVVVDEKASERGKKVLKLSNRAFLNPNDRPEPKAIDPETMKANMEKVYGKEMRKAASVRAKKKAAGIKVKKEEPKVKDEENHVEVKKESPLKEEPLKEEPLKKEELTDISAATE